MTELQAIEIIENVFKTHWHTWKFPIDETKFWMERLIKYDYSLAVKAIDRVYESQGQQQKPAPSSILGALRRHATIKSEADRNECIRLFEVCRADGRRRFFPFSGPVGTTVREIEAHALQVCRACNKKEPGHYINYFVGEE
ncbi:MAG: hypothetical protein IMZ61_14100 [Planctomycetes bacterium]|nr:hypothetical protein [Chloroflexota bacterium]MBE3145031.1 hypothetical protein [Planctomycetota bacterium]